jgi:hypothetical protein
MKTIEIPLEKIQIKFFVRTGLNLEHVKFLRSLYEADETVTPIEVVETEEKGIYELIDGRHRIEAVREAGFLKIEAVVYKGLTQEQKILNAILANLGGALPPTLQDFEHTMELLIDLKMTRKEILDSFPLPTKITAVYYKLTMSKIYKQTIRKAVDLVIKGNVSVKDAALKFKVDLLDLRHAISSSKEGRNTNIEDFLKGLEYSVRSLSGNLSKKTQAIIESFEAGDLSRNDLIRWSDRIRQSSKKLAATAEAMRVRLENTIKPKEAEREEAEPKISPSKSSYKPKPEETQSKPLL